MDSCLRRNDRTLDCAACMLDREKYVLPFVLALRYCIFYYAVGIICIKSSTIKQILIAASQENVKVDSNLVN